MYLQALQFAYKAHKKQVRKQSCVPYIVHPIRVSGYFNDDISKTVAVLHDVVEDTDFTLEDIYNNFGRQITEVIDILTKRKDESHFSYINRIKKSRNEIAIQVKIADIVDNLSDRLMVCDKETSDKYNEALKILI